MNDKPDPLTYFPPIPAYELDYAEYKALNRCDWRIKPGKAALLIYDMQNCYVGRYEDPSALLANINTLRCAARAAELPVIYAVPERITDLAQRGISVDLWGPGIGHGQPPDSQYNEIHPALAPHEDDFIITKSKYSGFFRTGLEDLLNELKRDQIILCGNYANHGCMVTAIDAYMRNLKVFFIADALGATSPQAHDMALRYVADTSGQIALTDEVIARLSG